MERGYSAMKNVHLVIVLMVLSIVVPPLLAWDVSWARRGGGGDDRTRFYGIVQSRPSPGLHGEWLIGGQRVTTHSGTEFDQREGALAVGTCAKVDFRRGGVHEIDSEPMSNCL